MLVPVPVCVALLQPSPPSGGYRSSCAGTRALSNTGRRAPLRPRRRGTRGLPRRLRCSAERADQPIACALWASARLRRNEYELGDGMPDGRHNLNLAKRQSCREKLAFGSYCDPDPSYCDDDGPGDEMCTNSDAAHRAGHLCSGWPFWGGGCE
jgi:hypothetical protein